MKQKDLKKHLLSKPLATKEYPFGPEPMVVKVMSKMFALVSVDENPLRITLKCDPEDAQIQRAMYDSIRPGYHMNKEHWNTITYDDSIPDDVLTQMIDESYKLVVKGLKKQDREKIMKIKTKRKNSHEENINPPNKPADRHINILTHTQNYDT